MLPWSANHRHCDLVRDAHSRDLKVRNKVGADFAASTLRAGGNQQVTRDMHQRVKSGAGVCSTSTFQLAAKYVNG